MVVKTQDVRTPCYSDIYNIINNYTNTYYLYTLLFAKLYAENVINKAFHKHGVASFTGAWIETPTQQMARLRSAGSHPLRVRGLKRRKYEDYKIRFLSHPLRVRGLKHIIIVKFICKITSHPLRVRGLKPCGRCPNCRSNSRILYGCVD